MHDHGISREGDLLDLAIEDRLIDKSGSWISYGEMRLGQGRENAKQYLRENAALMDEITRKVLEKRGLLGPQPTAESNGEPASPAKPEPTKKDGGGRRQQAAATAE
jgi:recombination protein RecA